jgi:hypothetical protein
MVEYRLCINQEVKIHIGSQQLSHMQNKTGVFSKLTSKYYSITKIQ